jgi:hypothetical protein
VPEGARGTKEEALRVDDAKSKRPTTSHEDTILLELEGDIWEGTDEDTSDTCLL